MKKKIIWLTVCAFLILLIGGGVLFLLKGSPKCGLLKMNGIDVTKENVMIHSDDYAELPLTEVMKSLDMTVDWVDDNTADIAYKDKKYTLDLSNISLIENEQSFNLLLPPPGGTRFYKILEKELVLDSNTIKSAMYLMGTKINIDIDRKEQIVYIVEITD